MRGFPVQLHFSLSLSPSGEKSLGENDESSVKQDTKNTHGAARAGTARPCLKHGERERGDKDKKMLEVAPASTKEPRPGPSACQRQRGRARGCHQPSRVTSGGWGREVTATTSHRGETFPSARAALVTKEREQGTACGGWDGGGGHPGCHSCPPGCHSCPQTTAERQGWILQPSNGLAERTRSWKRGGTQTPAPPKLFNPSLELCSSRRSGSKPFPSRRAIPPGSKPSRGRRSRQERGATTPLCHAGSWGTLGTARGRWHSPGWPLALPVAPQPQPCRQLKAWHGAHGIFLSRHLCCLKLSAPCFRS